jgi:hypothetical protein
MMRGKTRGIYPSDLNFRASLILRIEKSKEWERDRNRKGWQVQYSLRSLCIGFEE